MGRSSTARSHALRARTWFACFGIATVMGLLVALQRWSASTAPNKSSYWDGQFLQPQLIPWYAWAVLAPLVMLVLDRLPGREAPRWRRVATYLGVAVGAILTHAVVSALALGYWWAFPSLVPMDPAWHIADQLSSRAVLSVLVVWLIVATYHGRAASVPVVVPPAGRADAEPPPGGAPRSSHLTLRTADRVWFVAPADIDWIEADGDHVIVHAGAAHYRVRDTISAMESRVPADQLVRVSRSAIVNRAAIREMQRWFRGNYVILLRDGARVITGARYRDRIVPRV